jgi:hypothetical protein
VRLRSDSVVRGMCSVRCAERVTRLPALRRENAVAEAGRIVGPVGILRVVGDLGPAAVALVVS